MDHFKQAISAALRREDISAEGLDVEEFELLIKIRAQADAVAVLTEELLDSQAADVVIGALLNRAAIHDPACRGLPS